MKVLNSYVILDLRVVQVSTPTGDPIWMLLDDGCKDAEGIGKVLAQGTREEVRDRLHKELEEA